MCNFSLVSKASRSTLLSFSVSQVCSVDAAQTTAGWAVCESLQHGCYGLQGHCPGPTAAEDSCTAPPCPCVRGMQRAKAGGVALCSGPPHAHQPAAGGRTGPPCDDWCCSSECPANARVPRTAAGCCCLWCCGKMRGQQVRRTPCSGRPFLFRLSAARCTLSCALRQGLGMLVCCERICCNACCHCAPAGRASIWHVLVVPARHLHVTVQTVGSTGRNVQRDRYVWLHTVLPTLRVHVGGLHNNQPRASVRFLGVRCQRAPSTRKDVSDYEAAMLCAAAVACAVVCVY